MGVDRKAPGLALAPKLKCEHVYLTSFSKMRVDLATQVTKRHIVNLKKYVLLGISLVTGDE